MHKSPTSLILHPVFNDLSLPTDGEGRGAAAALPSVVFQQLVKTLPEISLGRATPDVIAETAGGNQATPPPHPDSGDKSSRINITVALRSISVCFKLKPSV